MDEAALRREVVAAARRMNAVGINQGTSGNISVRAGSAVLITPSAVPYESMQPGDLARMELGGEGAWEGPRKPSTEWPFHLGILRGRPEMAAVVHTHAPHCTALSILRRDIPAVHYMIGVFGGAPIRCAPYAPFGTDALAAVALRALEGRNACLLANHGMIVAGPSLSRAMWLAEELEALARQYHLALLTGTPIELTEAELEDAMDRLAGYGAASDGAQPKM